MQPRFFSAHAVPNRDESFASLNEEDVTFFKSILDEENVLTDAGELEPYNEDWLRTWTGRSQVVLRPRTTEEVSQVLKHCNERHLAVVPQGGNTGLVGGSVPVHDEIVLSTSRMRDIEQVDTQGGIVVAQSGVVLEELDTHLAQHGLAVPLDLGAKGSCQIGGNVSTNAGGIRLCRYGSLHGSVLGLEAVLPDGRILDLCTALRKDNTGYDLKQLFIGAEGTLGVVTKVAMLAVPRPKSTQLALFACDNFDSVLALSMKARECLGEIVSAIEFGDAASFNTVAEHIQGARNPFEEEHAFFVVIESQGSNEEHDSAKFEAFLETALGEIDGVNDGVVAMDERQVREIWLLRESCAEALVKSGATYKYDISIPVSEFEHFVQMTQCRIDESDLPNKENLHACGYGHLGDGNLHLNVHSPGDFEHHKAVVDVLEPWLFEEVAKVRGSISAEHGIGQMKPHFLHLTKSEVAIETMQGIKQLMDPKGIMAPYKVLPLPAPKLRKLPKPKAKLVGPPASRFGATISALFCAGAVGYAAGFLQFAQ